LAGISLLNLLFARADIFVLGKLYSAADLGLYAMGIALVQTPATFLMNLLGQTLLPVHSQVQADKARVNRVVHTTTSLVLLVGLPALTCLAFCSRSVLTIVYGHRYAAAAAPLLIASGVAVLNILNGQLTMVFYAAGRPNLHRTAVAVMAGTMVTAIYPFTMWLGMAGGQWAALLSVAIGLGIQLIRVHSMTGLDCRSSGPVLAYAVCGSLAVATTCLGARMLSLSNQPIPTLASGIGGCLLALSLYYVIFFQGGRRAAIGI
jgi:PST family polysaccharide transporter